MEVELLELLGHALGRQRAGGVKEDDRDTTNAVRHANLRLSRRVDCNLTNYAAAGARCGIAGIMPPLAGAATSSAAAPLLANSLVRSEERRGNAQLRLENTRGTVREYVRPA